MRKIFSFINLKDVCSDKGLPYKVTLEVLFGKRRLKNLDLPYEELAARMAIIVQYNHKTKNISYIKPCIVLTVDDDSGAVLTKHGKTIYSKSKYVIDIQNEVPYYKDLYKHISNLLNDRMTKDEYLAHTNKGLKAMWDAFFEKVSPDVIKEYDSYPTYALMVHYWDLNDLEKLTSINLKDYYDKEVTPDAVRMYVYYTQRGDLLFISYQISGDEYIPNVYLNKLNEIFYSLPEYLDSLEINQNIVDVVRNLYKLAKNKRDLYTQALPDKNAFIGDMEDLRKYNFRTYNKLKKLLELQFKDIEDIFNYIPN